MGPAVNVRPSSQQAMEIRGQFEIRAGRCCSGQDKHAPGQCREMEARVLRRGSCTRLKLAAAATFSIVCQLVAGKPRRQPGVDKTL